jgi:hypothetical protein
MRRHDFSFKVSRSKVFFLKDRAMSQKLTNVTYLHNMILIQKMCLRIYKL